MKKQEILMNLVLAHQEKKWDRIESILRDEGMAIGSCPPTPQIIPTNDFQKFEIKKQNENKSVNNFVDDLTLETKEIDTDKKITANIRRATRRPPTNDSAIVSVNCRNCNDKMSVSAYEANLRSSADSSFTCGKCLKRIRGSR